MAWFVRVTTGAMQRAVARDFKRQKRPVPVQNPRPGRYDLDKFHTGIPRAATMNLKKTARIENRRLAVPNPQLIGCVLQAGRSREICSSFGNEIPLRPGSRFKKGSASSQPRPPIDWSQDVIRGEEWSGREDLNLRPPGPEPGALPGCATPRLSGTSRVWEACSAHIVRLQPYHAIRNFRREGETCRIQCGLRRRKASGLVFRLNRGLKGA